MAVECDTFPFAQKNVDLREILSVNHLEEYIMRNFMIFRAELCKFMNRQVTRKVVLRHEELYISNIRIFSSPRPPRPALGPTQSLIQWVPRVKRSGM
jgi:hypothetical protein